MRTSTSTTGNSPRSTTERRPPRRDGRPLVVLGVDPGTLVTGYGIVARDRRGLRLVAAGAVRNRSDTTMPRRLRDIFRRLEELVRRHRPDELAIETAFCGRNAQSALKLGHARGVAILAAVQHDLPAVEYAPREVKKAVTGRGTASKEQVQFMVRALLGLPDDRMPHDTSDALAVALCHLQRRTSPAPAHRTWAGYVAAHPERIAR